MTKMRLVVVALMLIALALPSFGKTYKNTYSLRCSEVWSAVKDTLSNPENYEVLASVDAQMTADYKVKHTTHVNVSGAILQRTNHVTLVSKDATCEMQVVSNYSGWEHDDKGDFRTHVDESLAKLKAATPAPAAKPSPPAK